MLVRDLKKLLENLDDMTCVVTETEDHNYRSVTAGLSKVEYYYKGYFGELNANGSGGELNSKIVDVLVII